jgi:hypothetical protein
MKGKLAKTENGKWVVYYWKEDSNSFEGGKFPILPQVQESISSLNYIEYILDNCEVEFEIVEMEQMDSEMSTNLYAKITSRVDNPNNRFKKIIFKISEHLERIDYEEGGIGDIGNEIGIAIGTSLNEKSEIEDFISGIKHGIDLVKK